MNSDNEGRKHLRHLKKRRLRAVDSSASTSTRKIPVASSYQRKFFEANKLINDESNRLITWSLSVVGGSVLAIVSTEYVNPKGWIVYCYALFAVGWIQLGVSIYYGEKLTRIYVASLTLNESDTYENSRELDEAFGEQIGFFKWGIAVFAIWLIIFLFWYIFEKY